MNPKKVEFPSGISCWEKGKAEEKFVTQEVHTMVTTCQTNWSRDSCGRDLTRTVPMPAFCCLFKLKLVSEPQMDLEGSLDLFLTPSANTLKSFGFQYYLTFC